LVMLTSALCVIVLVSMASAEAGDPKLGGFVAVTTLTTLPVAFVATVAVSLNVATPFTGSATVVLIAPVPLAAVQLAPPLAVHVRPPLALPAGGGPLPAPPPPLLGPAFVPVIVWVVVVPATTLVTPSSLVTASLATGAFRATLAVAVLLPGAGSFVA